MKQVGSFLSKVATYSVALLITSLAVSALAQMQQGQAKVVAVKGSAQYSEGGAWMPLKTGTILKAGSVVQTAAGSYAKLTLFDNGKSLELDEQTTVGLTKLTCEKTGTDLVIETELNLTAGRVLGNVKKTSNASRYEVKSPVSTVGIRGTTYEATAAGLARCFSGALNVAFKAQDGTVSQYQVNAGYTFDPALRTVVATPEGYNPGFGLPTTEGEEGNLPWAFAEPMSLPITSPGLAPTPIKSSEPNWIVDSGSKLIDQAGGIIVEPPITQTYPVGGRFNGE
jgi:hypothetical protein